MEEEEEKKKKKKEKEEEKRAINMLLAGRSQFGLTCEVAGQETGSRLVSGYAS